MANLERHEKYHPRLHNFQIGFTFSVNAQFGSNLDWSSACLRCFPPPAHLIQISFKQALQKPDKDYDHLTPDTYNLDHFTLLFWFFLSGWRSTLRAGQRGDQSSQSAPRRIGRPSTGHQPPLQGGAAAGVERAGPPSSGHHSPATRPVHVEPNPSPTTVIHP